jgi:hypothetical protein
LRGRKEMAEQKKPPKKDGSIAKNLSSYCLIYYPTSGEKNQAPKRKNRQNHFSFVYMRRIMFFSSSSSPFMSFSCSGG